MQLIGFNLTKISSERFITGELPKERKISTNIEFTNIEKDKPDLLDEEVLKVYFKFSIIYEPKIADIFFEGVIMLKLPQDQLKKVMKTWKKKKFDEELQMPLLNFVLNKCSIKALQLEEELNLPPHLKLPTLQKKQD